MIAHVQGLHRHGAALPATVPDDIDHVADAIVSRVEEAAAARLSDIILEQVTSPLAQHFAIDAASQDDTEVEFVHTPLRCQASSNSCGSQSGTGDFSPYTGAAGIQGRHRR